MACSRGNARTPRGVILILVAVLDLTEALVPILIPILIRRLFRRLITASNEQMEMSRAQRDGVGGGGLCTALRARVPRARVRVGGTALRTAGGRAVCCVMCLRVHGAVLVGAGSVWCGGDVRCGLGLGWADASRSLVGAVGACLAWAVLFRCAAPTSRQ